MKQKIFTKAFAQIIIGVALSIIYMQIRPYESITLQWPFSFLGVWYLLWAWIAYLKLDRLSVFEVTERYKKQIEEDQIKHESNYFNQKTPTFMNYIYTPIQKSDSKESKDTVLKTRIYANLLCFVAFIALAIIL